MDKPITARKTSQPKVQGKSIWSRTKSVKHPPAVETAEPPAPAVPASEDEPVVRKAPEQDHSLVPGPLDKLPAWYGTEGSKPIRDSLRAPRYLIHNRMGPKYYKNHHLIPPHSLRPSSRPPSVFSPSFPPMAPSGSQERLNISTSLARSPSSSPSPTPSSSQTGFADLPVNRVRTRKNSQDNVDMLDVTDPWGLNYHHQSPYDLGQAPMTTGDSSEASKHASAARIMVSNYIHNKQGHPPARPRVSSSQGHSKSKTVIPSPLSQSTSAVHLQTPEMDGPRPARKLSKRRKPVSDDLYGPSSDTAHHQQSASMPNTPFEDSDDTAADQTSTVPPPSSYKTVRSASSASALPLHVKEEKKEKRTSVFGRIARRLSIMRKPSSQPIHGRKPSDDWQHVKGKASEDSSRRSAVFTPAAVSSEKQSVATPVEAPKRVAAPSVVESPRSADDDNRSSLSLEAPYGMGRLTIANPDAAISSQNTPVMREFPRLPAKEGLRPEQPVDLRHSSHSTIQPPQSPPLPSLPPFEAEPMAPFHVPQSSPMLVVRNSTILNRNPTTRESVASVGTIPMPPFEAPLPEIPNSPSMMSEASLPDLPFSPVPTLSALRDISMDSPFSGVAPLGGFPPTPWMSNVFVPPSPALADVGTPGLPAEASLAPKEARQRGSSPSRAIPSTPAPSREVPLIPYDEQTLSWSSKPREPSPVKQQQAASPPCREASPTKVSLRSREGSPPKDDDRVVSPTSVTSKRTETFRLVRTNSGNILGSAGEQWEVVESEAPKRSRTKDKSSSFKAKDRDSKNHDQESITQKEASPRKETREERKERHRLEDAESSHRRRRTSHTSSQHTTLDRSSNAEASGSSKPSRTRGSSIDIPESFPTSLYPDDQRSQHRREESDAPRRERRERQASSSPTKPSEISRSQDDRESRRDRRRAESSSPVKGSSLETPKPTPAPILAAAPSAPPRERKTSLRPTSELSSSAADMNAVRARESWEVDRLRKGRSMYSGNDIVASYIPADDGASSRTDDRDFSTIRSAGHGSNHTSFSVQRSFYETQSTNGYSSSLPPMRLVPPTTAEIHATLPEPPRLPLPLFATNNHLPTSPESSAIRTKQRISAT